jgi:hypothetical protein
LKSLLKCNAEMICCVSSNILGQFFDC